MSEEALGRGKKVVGQSTSPKYHPQPVITGKGCIFAHRPENETAKFHDSESCGNKAAD